MSKSTLAVMVNAALILCGCASMRSTALPEKAPCDTADNIATVLEAGGQCRPDDILDVIGHDSAFSDDEIWLYYKGLGLHHGVEAEIGWSGADTAQLLIVTIPGTRQGHSGSIHIDSLISQAGRRNKLFVTIMTETPGGGLVGINVSTQKLNQVAEIFVDAQAAANLPLTYLTAGNAMARNAWIQPDNRNISFSAHYLNEKTLPAIRSIIGHEFGHALDEGAHRPRLYQDAEDALSAQRDEEYRADSLSIARGLASVGDAVENFIGPGIPDREAFDNRLRELREEGEMMAADPATNTHPPPLDRLHRVMRVGMLRL